MIESWQVWSIDIEDGEEPEERLFTVISSDVHLRSQHGRNVLVAPITDQDQQLRNRVRITDPDGASRFVMTEQTRFISTTRFLKNQPAWTLAADEIAQVRRMLLLMVDF